MSRYIANGNMYGCSYTFSSPFSNMKTEPFKTSVNELYNFMLRRRLDRAKKYDDDDADIPIEFVWVRNMQNELMHDTNPLFVILDNDAYYFTDSKGIRRIDKYESS